MNHAYFAHAPFGPSALKLAPTRTTTTSQCSGTSELFNHALLALCRRMLHFVISCFAACTLSTKKSVPISLLIMSRAFTLQAPDPAKALAQSISAMDEDVVTEVSCEHQHGVRFFCCKCHFYLPAPVQAVVTGAVSSPPRYMASFYRAKGSAFPFLADFRRIMQYLVSAIILPTRISHHHQYDH